jgi:thiol-disulfide isomerase/thioredoxin
MIMKTKNVLILAVTMMVMTSFIHCKGTGADKGGNGSGEIGLNIGDVAPEINFENPDGEKIALSSLRGKMVLIDFWAAWCPPCRRENPNLVRTYNEYKDKKFQNGDGFTIYGVSLDRTKEAWVKAIEDDGLVWENHVSDLKYWSSVPAAMYQVRSIPDNFLIDGDGVIVARRLRGEQLDNALKNLLK